DGTVLTTITNLLFDMPWGMATNGRRANPQDGAVTSFFTTNAGNATIDRIDVIPTNGAGLPTFRVVQIGQLTQMGNTTMIAVAWLTSLNISGTLHMDVLLALDPANDRIAAFSNSTTVNTAGAKLMDKGITVFQGKPLNRPGGICANPANGDLLVVNQQDN